MEGKMIGQHLKSEENIEGRGEMVIKPLPGIKLNA